MGSNSLGEGLDVDVYLGTFVCVGNTAGRVVLVVEMVEVVDRVVVVDVYGGVVVVFVVVYVVVEVVDVVVVVCAVKTQTVDIVKSP